MKKYVFAQVGQVTQDILVSGKRLIYMAGASASGKSYIAQELAKQLESAWKSVLTISSDNYYNADSTIKSVILGTYDHPKLIDYKLLAHDIDQYFSEGKFMLPMYSFSESRRTGYVEVQKKADIVIVEWLYTISQLPIKENSIKIFISSSPEDLIIRRLLRDPSRVGEPLYMIVGALNNVFPMWNLYGKWQEKMADIIIENDYDLLKKDGKKSYCMLWDGSLEGKKETMKEEVVEYIYDDSWENTNGKLLVNEYYQDGYLKSVGISKTISWNTCHEDWTQRISMRIYKSWILTQLHSLLQNAGLQYEWYVEYTQTTYLDKDGKRFVVEDRKDGKVIRSEE